MARAATEDGLWQRLSGGIGPVRTVADAADEHMALYRELLTPRVAAIAEPAADTAAKRRRPLVRGEGVSPARA